MLRTGLLKSTLMLCVLALVAACGGEGGEGGGAGGRSGQAGGQPEGGFGGGPGQSTAVPVEVTAVTRRDIASYIETNGTLEAESEVDIVARAAGPIVELLVEENTPVRNGQLLARIDQEEIKARLEVSRVALDEAETAFERAEALQRANLLSAEAYEQARSRLDSARAAHSGNQIQLSYTEIRAPFSGLIVRRYVKFAETVSVNQPLFRLSDFDPLLCPIQVPERELQRLAIGQPAYLTVDAWPGERFAAKVLRLSPVVDAATGTIKVTLEVDAAGKLRPGMFGSVFLQTDTHRGALVIPKSALVLNSVGDAVFVAEGDHAARREVALGVREGDLVEVTSGLAEGEPVISVGQDSLSDGTPIEVLDAAGAGGAPAAAAPRGGFGGGPGGELTPERLKMIEQRMRERGMSEAQIEERLEQMRQGAPAAPAAPEGAPEGAGESRGTGDSGASL